VAASTSWNTQGLPKPGQGLLYLYYPLTENLIVEPSNWQVPSLEKHCSDNFYFNEMNIKFYNTGG